MYFPGHGAERRATSLERGPMNKVFVPIFAAVLAAAVVLAQDGKPPGAADAGGSKTVGVAIAAAIAVSVSILGAGYAVGRIGSAAIGAVTEKPELLPRTILFLALAEGLAVLGFAVAMILLQKA